MVYDATAKTVTGWIDYHLSRTAAVEVPLAWDDGPFLIAAEQITGD